MEKQKITKVEVTRKNKKNYVKLFVKQVVVNKEFVQFSEENTKKSDQPMNRELASAWERLGPHLMYGSEMCDTTILLDESIDERKWFNEAKFLDEERFQGVECTRVEFVTGAEGVLEGVKLYGHRTTQLTEKPFKAPLETPVLSLARGLTNGYKLVVVLDEHIQDVLDGLVRWHEHGETLSKIQMEADLA